MALSIKNSEADRLALELADETGESLTDAIIQALRERLRRERGRIRGLRLSEELQAIRKRCSALHVIDSRYPEEILGYDDRGLPS